MNFLFSLSLPLSLSPSPSFLLTTPRPVAGPPDGNASTFISLPLPLFLFLLFLCFSFLFPFSLLMDSLCTTSEEMFFLESFFLFQLFSFSLSCILSDSLSILAFAEAVFTALASLSAAASRVTGLASDLSAYLQRWVWMDVCSCYGVAMVRTDKCGNNCGKDGDEPGFKEE